MGRETWSDMPRFETCPRIFLLTGHPLRNPSTFTPIVVRNRRQRVGPVIDSVQDPLTPDFELRFTSYGPTTDYGLREIDCLFNRPDIIA